MSRSQLKKRQSAIIRQLCELSRNGWRQAHISDYRPLETELAAIYAALRAPTASRVRK